MRTGRQDRKEKTGRKTPRIKKTLIIKAVENSNYKGTNKSTFTINKYGANAQDKLLLDFKDGNAAYQEMYDQATFENNLIVTDLNHNVLEKSEYQVSYSTDGATWTTTMPNSVGTYYVKVSGTNIQDISVNDGTDRLYDSDDVVYISKILAFSELILLT